MSLSPWQRAICERGELYRVGGFVRDELMGLHRAGDTDFLVRGIEPRDLEALLAGYGKLSLVGKSFGVYKLRPSNEDKTYDLVYPRREQSTGTGHRDFDVRWDWEMSVADDLGRRDFTINAIAQNVVDGEIIDPHNGREDIRSRLLRMIFPEAFREDPLRILRGIRFCSRFNLSVEAGTLEAMKEGAALLSTLSAERVGEEFAKLLTQAERPSTALQLMHDVGALKVVLPELDRAVGVEQNVYHPDDVFVHSIKSCDQAGADDLVVRWAALMHDVGKVAAKQTVTDEGGEPRVVFYGHEKLSAEQTSAALKRLRYSGEFVQRCSHLVRHHMFNYETHWNDSTVRRFMRRVGKDSLDQLFALREADCRSRDLTAEIKLLKELEARVRKQIDADNAITVSDLAIGGAEVMKILGIPGGPRVGEVLDLLLERVIENPALNDAETLTAIVRREG